MRCALERAIANRKPPQGVVHHSDQGVQYTSRAYMERLRHHGMLPSMSRPANPYDNATCESFLKTLKREEIHASSYRNFESLHERIEEFIEQYYNRCRLHSALGYRSPEGFEEVQAKSEGASAGAIVTFFWPITHRILKRGASKVRRCDAHICLNKGFTAQGLTGTHVCTKCARLMCGSAAGSGGLWGSRVLSVHGSPDPGFLPGKLEVTEQVDFLT
jgi:hypothetical protein